MFAIVPLSASAAIGDVLSEDAYLTFTAETAGSTVTLNVQSGSDFRYYLNGAGLTDYTPGTSITLQNVGDYVRFSGKDTIFNYSNHVSLTGTVACSGNVMSLRLDDDGKVQGLAENCFQYMFYGCTNLTKAPELPETELVDRCYYQMFFGCTNLTEAPELPATNLADNCYYNMFNGCTNLTKAPELPATNLANSCYYSMFNRCTNLTKAPELPATTLAGSCYNNMFYGCTSLTELPALPATTLASSCYNYMFNGCTNICISDETGTFDGITYSAEYRIPTTGEGTSAYNALNNMFKDTGGKFTGTPDINTTYYVPAPAVPVTITAGDNMTKTTNSGAASQTVLSGAITDVVYTADTGYYFPENYSVEAVNGISVTRDSYTQITVSGTPTADAEITLPAPTAKDNQSVPETTGFSVTNATNATSADGVISGVTSAMEYSLDGTAWTAVTGTTITGLNPGDVQIRLKGDDTHNASEAVTVAVGDAALISAKTTATNTVNGVNATDYVTADQETVTNAKTTALAAINAATTEDEVTAAMTTFNNAIAACTTQAVPKFTNAALELGGVLSLRFYVNYPANWDGANDKVTFSVSGRSIDVPYANSKTDTNGRYFACPVYAYEMNDTITATYYHESENVDQTVYTVKQNLDHLVKNETGNAQTLAQATMNYGHYIQPYLAGLNDWTVGTDHVEMPYSSTISAGSNPAGSYTHTWNTRTDAVASASYYLTLNDTTTLNVVVTLDDATMGNVTATADGKAVTPENLGGNSYLISLPGIPANGLGIPYTFTLSVDGGKVFDLSISGLAYVNLVYTYGNPTDEEKQALTALYDYAVAAKNYDAN